MTKPAKTLVQLISTWQGETSPCWIDPATVTIIAPAGMPATTRIEYENRGCILVLGTPEDVHAALFPAKEASVTESAVEVVAK